MTDSAAKVARPRRLYRITFRLGWHRSGHDNRITGRIHHLLLRRTRWWDWGHRVMILVGTPVGGNYQEPQPATWWYHISGQSTVRLVKTYNDYRAASAADKENDWHWIGWDQDNELRLGYYESQNFYGLNRIEQRLLTRWLLAWHLKNWFGLRTWLYFRALHAAVNAKVPFTCQTVPPKRSGGYSHWHCQLKRRHQGPHRFNNYTWTGDGQAVFEPVGIGHD